MLRTIFFSALLAYAGASTAYQPPETQPDGWPVADAASVGWDVATLDALDAKLADKDHAGITSVAVAYQGRLVHEVYANGGSRDRLNDMRSATKTLTALLVGAAVDRGKIPGDEAQGLCVFPRRRPRARPRRTQGRDVAAGPADHEQRLGLQ